MPLWAAAIIGCVAMFGLILAFRVHQRSAASQGGVERVFGLAMALLGVGLFTRGLRSSLAPLVSPERLLWFLGGTRFIVAIGIGLLFVGVWRFYRRDSAVSAVGALLGTAVVLGSWATLAVSGGDHAASFQAPAEVVFLACQMVAFSWWGLESHLYHLRLRKQVALGLAEPIIADRFRLMAHATLSLAALMGLRLVYPWFSGQRLSQLPALLLVIAVLAIYALVNLYCALLSPAVYRRWLASRLEKTTS